MASTRREFEALDAADPLAHLRERFHIPAGLNYLDGNSLGVMPVAAKARVAQCVSQEWGEDLITSWNVHGWFHQPRVLGNAIGRLIGAAPDSVIVCDTISVNLFKILSAAVAQRRSRKIILSDSGNFPSDLYVAQGLSSFLADGHALKVVAPEDVEGAITEEVGVVMVTEVDYRTARRHDMKAITAKAHAKGCLIIWDLAHSAGAVPVDLMGADADFAVGCTYKYINGGPGSPAFLFVHPRLQNEVQPGLVGWWGHARPFDFAPDYVPAPGIIRQQCGTQPILSMAGLAAAMEAWADVDMEALHAKAKALCSAFIDLVEPRGAKHGLRLAGPRDMAGRGSHVSFHCPEGYAVMQALIAARVIGDFRAPDIIRFGFTPLYTRYVDVWDAAEVLGDILDRRTWNKPEFLSRKAVT
jgi:kynureninase